MPLPKKNRVREEGYRLGVRLYNEQRYAEAEQVLRESVQEQEKVLGTSLHECYS